MKNLTSFEVPVLTVNLNNTWYQVCTQVVVRGTGTVVVSLVVHCNGAWYGTAMSA